MRAELMQMGIDSQSSGVARTPAQSNRRAPCNLEPSPLAVTAPIGVQWAPVRCYRQRFTPARAKAL